MARPAACHSPARYARRRGGQCVANGHSTWTTRLLAARDSHVFARSLAMRSPQRLATSARTVVVGDNSACMQLSFARVSANNCNKRVARRIFHFVGAASACRLRPGRAGGCATSAGAIVRGPRSCDTPSTTAHWGQAARPDDGLSRGKGASDESTLPDPPELCDCDRVGG